MNYDEAQEEKKMLIEERAVKAFKKKLIEDMEKWVDSDQHNPNDDYFFIGLDAALKYIKKKCK